MKYLLILSMLMYSGVGKSQEAPDTNYFKQGVYVMEMHVRPIEDHCIFGFIPYAEGESVFPLAVAIALLIVLIFGLIAVIYEKITLKNQP